jgi:hypothetical protein
MPGSPPPPPNLGELPDLDPRAGSAAARLAAAAWDQRGGEEAAAMWAATAGWRRVGGAAGRQHTSGVREGLYKAPEQVVVVYLSTGVQYALQYRWYSAAAGGIAGAVLGAGADGRARRIWSLSGCSGKRGGG